MFNKFYRMNERDLIEEQEYCVGRSLTEDRVQILTGSDGVEEGCRDGQEEDFMASC